MHFIRLGDYLAVSRITGPRHNLLQLRLGVGEQSNPNCECLPTQVDCRHEPLVEADIIASILAAVSTANDRLGTKHAVTHIRYVQNDTKPEDVYGVLALKLIEHIYTGGTFTEGKNAL